MDISQPITPEPAAQIADTTQPKTRKRFGPPIAIVVGVLLGVLFGGISHANATWRRVSGVFSSRADSGLNAPALRPAGDPNELDRLKPQKQAEVLLELAVGNSDGAVDQISNRVERWRGQLKWDSQIATLTTAALNSNDMRTRQSGVEVELAAYGLSKSPSNVDALVKVADSSHHSQKIWALWALGLMANRGVEQERIVQVLTAHLKDSDEEARRWTVEGLALAGTTPAIVPLLRTMHDDASPGVRERAACSLAQSGMFTQEQRFTAVPQLLNYSEDPSLDAQTHAWAFQALGEITHQRLPNNSASWRAWYETARTE
jgi:hypothetical protein